ncbi:hypothetical protein [Liquorilactobacillus hordei]|uniref:hypothetical protein n=1 Tax=Liquorilactobacillus hordei TaxID=468911 RepID=UPI001CBF8509|nr:hypothetical protein [Liquorilactobacillus hordei]MBZ2406672.1 hypothetical protein [Liquorilactobacillus hordei]
MKEKIEKKWNSFFELNGEEKETFGEIVLFLIKVVLTVPLVFAILEIIPLIGTLIQMFFN